jgi:hypothetical protein
VNGNSDIMTSDYGAIPQQDGVGDEEQEPVVAGKRRRYWVIAAIDQTRHFSHSSFHTK